MTCAVANCEKTIGKRGYCWGHYDRWKKHGDPLPNKPLRAFTKRSTSGVYVRIWEPTHPLAMKDGYVLEHRKVLHDGRTCWTAAA
jgi:hypothetical protein